MTGPVCPHCGDLAHGCACPPGPYVGELSADAIYPCWLSDIDRANFAEYEATQLRDQLAAEREAYAHGLALARADLHREREQSRPLRHEVEQARARVAALEGAIAAVRDARQRADALASSGTVAMVEAYEAEDAAVVAAVALLPGPSPEAGKVGP